MTDKQSPKKDQKSSPCRNEGLHHGTCTPPESSVDEDHVSDQSVKQSLFSKIRSVSLFFSEKFLRSMSLFSEKFFFHKFYLPRAQEYSGNK